MRRHICFRNNRNGDGAARNAGLVPVLPGDLRGNAPTKGLGLATGVLR